MEEKRGDANGRTAEYNGFVIRAALIKDADRRNEMGGVRFFDEFLHISKLVA